MKKRNSVILVCLGFLLLAAAVSLTCYNDYITRKAAASSSDILRQLNAAREVRFHEAETAPAPEEPSETQPVDVSEPLPETVEVEPPETEAPETEPSEPEPAVLPAEPAPPETEPAEEPAPEEDPHEMPVEIINGVGYVGTLTFPSLGLTLPIGAVSEDDLLRLSPCLYSGNVYDDNMVICGHNFTVHFGKIGNLKKGAEVVFVDMNGRMYDYTVAETVMIDAYDFRGMTESGYALSLFTCTLDGQRRLTVRCERTEN